jgi:hypothetical protein
MVPVPKLVVRLAFLVFALTAGALRQQSEFAAIADDTDWWSLIRPIELGPHLKWQNRMLSKEELKVADVQLGNDVRAVRKKLGAATVIARGDAAVGREQVCYKSPQGENFLIFEWGEVDSNVYLFTSSKNWNGKDKCMPLQLVTPDLKFANGLKLGMSPAQVTHILGRPSRRTQTTLLYFLQAEEKRHTDTDGPVLTAYIDARFNESKLKYLGILISETF